MAEIKKHYHTFTGFNTTVYALSIDSQEQSEKLKTKMELPFELLCDEKKEAVNSYGLLNPYEHGGIARPAVFLIMPDGRICYRSIDGTAKRVDQTHIMEFLKDLQQNPDQSLHEDAPKKWIVPSLSISALTIRNLFVMGNRADWKHTLTFPGNFIVIPVKKWLKKRKRK